MISSMLMRRRVDASRIGVEDGFCTDSSVSPQTKILQGYNRLSEIKTGHPDRETIKLGVVQMLSCVGSHSKHAGDSTVS